MAEELRESLSPSRINFFLECPGGWAAKYLLGYEVPITEQMSQGSRVEDHINMRLLMKKEEAEHPFLDSDENLLQALKEESWEDMSGEDHLLSDLGFDFLSQLVGDRLKNLSLQNKVNYIKGDAEIQGYMDYFDGENIYDLKVTKAHPYKVRMNHVRQMVVYSLATRVDAYHLVYLVRTKKPKVAIWSNVKGSGVMHIRDETIAQAKWDISWAIKQIVYHTRLFRSKGIITVPFDFSHYRMSGMDHDAIRNDLTTIARA